MSLELRKGTWPWRERRAAMTSPRADSDLLMCCASRRRLPSAPDLPTRSEPARSTKFSFPVGRVLGRSRPPQRGPTRRVLRPGRLSPSLTRGAEAGAAVHATHGDDEQGVGAGAVLVQVGELGCAVGVAELEHLDGWHGRDAGSRARSWSRPVPEHRCEGASPSALCRGGI